MDLNLTIIDQQVGALADRNAAAFEQFKNDVDKIRSAAFVVLVVKTLLDLPEDEAMDCLTEGGQDFGIDALDLGDVRDGEFVVALFQGKYKKNPDGNANFPQTGLEKMLQAVRCIFDPNLPLDLNPALLARVEEVRSRIKDGFLPQVRVVLCNNGARWTAVADKLIENSKFGDQVTFEHVNHDVLVGILQSRKPIDDAVQLAGMALVEEFDFRRVLVGKISVSEIKALFDRHGDRLLERNIRRYLGLSGNRVNDQIATTLRSAADQGNFYFYNNGITAVCTQFRHNALQGSAWQVRITGLQIINGGQTCKTIQAVLTDPAVVAEKAFVLIRLYELTGEDDLVQNITFATNSQNPVDLRDLKSNDEIQQRLEISIQGLGYAYKRQRSGDSSSSRTEITIATAAEAVLSVWRHNPQQAKFRSGAHFGSLYKTIFSEDLNGAQVILAVLLFRFAENRRRRPPVGAPDFIRYASCFLAMLMGRYLLADLGLQSPAGLDHRNFAKAKELVDTKSDDYFATATAAIQSALNKLYANPQQISYQRLSATFRRGDLLDYI